MKRKRANGKRKPKKPSVVGEDEPFNTTNHSGLNDFNKGQFESRREARTQQSDPNKGGQRAGLEELGAVNVRVEDYANSLPETDTSSPYKAATGISTRSSRRMGSSNKNLTDSAILLQRERTLQKEANTPHQDPRYKELELNAALSVIKKVMQMNAAGPFNVPVDPIALGIPQDYFDVIDTPMDFGTICSNLENGIKYLNSKDVFEDVQYIWENCSKYNMKGHYVLELMKQVKKNFSKYWTAAELYSEPPEGINGPLHLPAMESTMRGSKCGPNSPVGSMTDNPGHLQQHQMSLSPLELHQPSLSYNQICQPQQKPCQCQSSCVQPQPSQLEADIDISNAGHSHLPAPMESPMRCRTRGRKSPVGTTADNPIPQQNKMGPSESQLHQASASYKQPYQPQQRSFQCQPGSTLSQPSQPQAGTDICCAGGQLHLPSPTKSLMKSNTHGHRCVVGPMTDNASHQHHDQTGLRQPQLPQPSLAYSQLGQPQQWPCQCQPSTNQLQPSQTQTGTDIGGAGHTLLTPPSESTIGRSKCGPRCTVVPMADNPIHQWREQISSSQLQSHQPPAGHSQPYQPPQPLAVTDNYSADSSNVQRRSRGRGPTRCLKLWNRDGKRVSVAIDKLGQPIGEEAPLLTNFLGTLARNGHLAPLTYTNWTAFPHANKENMWQQVQSKFDIDPKSKSWVVKSLGKRWKDWKAKLKAGHYNTHETDEERLADRDERVLPDQWRILISFWNSEAAKSRSMQNKANRAQMKMGHATGTKSFARVREEQRAKRPDGKEPSRAELFIVTRTRKDGQPVNEASSVVISKLREQAAQQENSQNSSALDDIFSQVMGQDKHGRARTYGLGPSPSDLDGPKPSRDEAIKMVSEANAEVREMKERMMTMEQTCSQMAAQMATMMSMMSTMQRRSQDEHLSNVVANVIADISSGSEGSAPLQVNSSAFRSGIPPRERRTTKRGRKQNTSIGEAASKAR